MLIRSVAIARWNNDTEEPVILDAAYNLAEYSFFQRGRFVPPTRALLAPCTRRRGACSVERARSRVHAAAALGTMGSVACAVAGGCGALHTRSPALLVHVSRAAAHPRLAVTPSRALSRHSQRRSAPTRCSVKEFLNFAIKTLMKRLTAGVQCVDYEGERLGGVPTPARAAPAWACRPRCRCVLHHRRPRRAPRPPARRRRRRRRRRAGNMCFCLVGPEGLGAIAICDKEYPARVAVAMLKEQLAGFKGEMGTRWRGATDELACKYAPLEGALREYQEPAKVDKILKLDRQLTETKDILYKTIDAVLQRGEKLDDLVDKSAALSQQSKLFYKQAKKTNSCCSVM